MDKLANNQYREIYPSSKVVRRFAGKELERICIMEREDFRWIEQAPNNSHYFPVSKCEPKLSLCKNLFENTDIPLITKIPQGIEPNLYVYPTVPSPLFLFDLLFPQFSPDLNAEIAAKNFINNQEHFSIVFKKLGKFLAHLHSLPVPDNSYNINSYHSIREHIVCLTEFQSHFVERLELAEILNEFSTLKAWVYQAAKLEKKESYFRLIHGRFSLGACTYNSLPDSDIFLLGWLEFGIGNYLFDLGYLLGELVELATIGFAKLGFVEEHFQRAANAFLEGYYNQRRPTLTEQDLQNLFSYTAFRVVGHIAMRTSLSRLPKETITKVFHDAQIVIPHLIKSAVVDIPNNDMT